VGATKTVSNPLVGIAILNWTKPDQTIACIQSLQKLDYSAYHIVVVDNGSPVGQVGRLRQEFPTLNIIENGCNLGFAGGCNVGIDYLLRQGVDYVLLLNDDTEVAPDFLSRLVAVGESDELIGIVGPTIYYFDRPTIIWSAGGTISATGHPHHLHLNQDVHDLMATAEAIEIVDYVTGCALLIKRRVIESVGKLDERFFAYFEETEWCARARNAGYRVAYVPEASVWHKIETADRTYSWPYLYLMTRNRLLYLRCAGAGVAPIAQATSDMLRTALSWSIKPQHRSMRPYAGALVRGVTDFVRGHFGAPPIR
jgi:GT2 family glycosyltransferase